ncbi:hypothetical protein BP6252_11225 [Coleophoma cylindrospora]|uniref:Tat pathway signal sequence domain protein n=1 Tax=Coleophoma cylindrospora TaxID=1849047 RepID=A0A3D8QPW7_9HELO|nr:hypothetical protein BP6252_11225 [Coleophoma cylindrospora]
MGRNFRRWTAHAIPADIKPEGFYSICTFLNNDRPEPKANVSSLIELSVRIDTAQEIIEVKTGKITVTFSTAGGTIIQSIKNTNGGVTGRNGKLILLSQSSVASEYTPDPATKYYEFEGRINEAIVEQNGPVRAVITIKGEHHIVSIDKSDHHRPWLPFTLRFYLYAGSGSIRMVHTIVYDGDMNSDFIRGLGIRFDIPLENEALYDRHVRISTGPGVLKEAIQGITGLRRDPGPSVRHAQSAGKPTPPLELWDTACSSRLKWVQSWNDYTLSQLCADGFTLQKRTKSGSWVKVPGGTQAGGLAYLGGATRGGLAIGLRHFWERYPTGIDIRNAATDTGEMTVWLYSPAAAPIDMRPYHDGMNQESYADQLDALNITYEDWESGTGTPFGVARTNEVEIFSLENTPDQEVFAMMTEETRNPPVLVTDSENIYRSKAFEDYWSPISHFNTLDPEIQKIESNLEFMCRFYQTQISQRRWYGFWDHGDIMHAYDKDRQTWCYDVGGYAWDNSELSPDIWLWLYFLHTGRPDVYRMAEALTQHTGEVDVYHIGIHKGLRTRHGVQHWSDSCKQARVSNALYRKYFYYLSGGDEGVGDLLREVLDVEQTFLTLDPYRKARKDGSTYIADAYALSVSLGTDWSAMASAWIIELKVIASLTNGFVTGTAMYNMVTGEISPPPQDYHNQGHVQISHLSAMFGLFEVCAEIIERYPREVTRELERQWLEYCRYFNGTAEEQIKRFGISFGKLQLRQGHSRLTAYAAKRLGDKDLARRAWQQFYLEGEYGPEDGYGPDTAWESSSIGRGDALVRVDKAVWVSTNITALYGIAAIQNLALVGR